MSALPSSLSPETPLSDGQTLALLAMRRSELPEAVRLAMRQAGTLGPWGRHFYELARIGYAQHDGRFHVLTPRGRFAADRLALETARKLGMHVVTYNFGGPGQAARAYCTCGWSTFRSKAVGNYLGMLQRDAHHHRLHVASASNNKKQGGNNGAHHSEARILPEVQEADPSRHDRAASNAG